MRKYADVVLSQTATGLAQPVVGASVQILGHVSQTNATIFSDDGVTTTANPLTTDAQGRYQFYVANGRYDIKITAVGFTTFTLTDIDIHDETDITVPGETPLPGNLIFTGVNSHSGAESFTSSLTSGKVNGWCAIDGVQYTTLAAAIADATCTVVDDRGFKSGGTIASTITFPNGRPVTVLLANKTYTGPASGNTFVFGAGSHGSALIGYGTTSTGAGNVGNVPVTKILSNASNTSDVISVANAGGPVQGIRLEHIMVDGASSAVNCITTDTMQNSAWYNINVENCTAKGYNMITTSTTLNVGNQLNKLDHLRGAGSPQLFFCSGNAAGTADFTANSIVDLQGTYGVLGSSVPGIEINACDGNVFQGVTKPFRAAGTGFALSLDAPSGNLKGAISNQFYQFYGMATNNVTVGAGATGNFIYGYDVTNGEPAPVGAGNLLLAWQPNSVVGGAGGVAGLVLPNNTCLAWWNSTGGGSGDCILRFDGSNNLHFISQETSNYIFDSGPGAVFPNTGVSLALGAAGQPWSSLWLGTAATNNFKFNPLATTGARVINIPDFGVNAASTQNLSSTSILTAQYTNSTTSFTTVTGGGATLAFPVLANLSYTATCHLFYQAASTAGLNIQFTGPGSPTAITYGLNDPSSATAFNSAVATAFGTSLGQAAATNGVNFDAIVSLGLVNGANAGTVTLQAKSSAAAQLQIQAGSYCVVQ